MPKKINRALIQGILSKGEGVKSVSSEAVDWVISVAEQAAEQLAESGRRTPSGRLMAPRMDAGLQARTTVGHLTSETANVQELSRPIPTRLCYRAKETLSANGGERPGFPTDPEATSDWKYEVSNGDTILGYWEWLDHKKESKT